MKFFVYLLIFVSFIPRPAMGQKEATQFQERTDQIHEILNHVSQFFVLEKLVGIHFSHHDRSKIGPFFYKLLLEDTDGNLKSCLLSYKFSGPRKPFIRVEKCFE